MTNSSRRSEIIKILQESKTPQSGTALGEALGVSRQIIVQDIALLRTSGYDILSTNRGYILNESNTNPRRLVKVRHGSDRIEEELNLVVDLGGCVEDVLVNHRTYAKIEAPLNVNAESQEVLDEIVEALDKEGFLAEFTAYEKGEEKGKSKVKQGDK